MDNDPIRLTNHHVNRIMQGPPTQGRIRDALSCLGLMVLFVGVVYVAYGFGMGGM